MSASANDETNASTASSKLEKCLRTLYTADKFYGPTPGESGSSAVQTAYAEASTKSNSFEIDELNLLLQHGTPAGRLYGAVLLWKSGRVGPNLSYEKLLSDSAELQYQDGCKGFNATVKEIAKSLNDSGKFMNFQTRSMFCKLKAPIDKK